MNRKSAKLLTAAGGFCCLLAMILFGVIFYNETNFSSITAFSLFVLGAILIFVSLAYYTEK